MQNGYIYARVNNIAKSIFKEKSTRIQVGNLLF